MDRATLQLLAELRCRDAEALLDAGQWDGAYYLLGYSVECALKACAARGFLLHDVPEKTTVNAFYTHDFTKLLSISGIAEAMASHREVDPEFAAQWETVQDWNESKRYSVGITEAMARDMYYAVTNERSGVLPWMKTQWSSSKNS